MRINGHVHGGHAERDASGKLIPPLKLAWESKELFPEEYKKMTPEEYVEIGKKKHGVERVVLLDPPEVTFRLKEIFKDYVIAVPMVDMDNITPEEINSLFKRGAAGIKFIVPSKSYGDDSYFPLYDAITANHGLAIFHTGFVLLGRFEPGSWDARKTIVDITNMRPSALDRVARAFPDLKIIMAHLGNPWWEEAWKMISSHKNIYADLSGGDTFRRSIDMWKEILAPNGNLDTGAVSKLCFGTDGQSFLPGHYGTPDVYKLYERLFDVLKIPTELQEKVNRGNILKLLEN
jgi:predicted TIM-barrel fold metal-dependent hydrolase